MKTDIRFIDTHAHLNLSAFADDVDVVAARCVEKGVGMINIGTKQSTSARAVELAAQYAHMYAIVGLHPIQTVPGTHDEDEIGEGGQSFTSRGEVVDVEALRALAQSPKVVGIGECGFDYYRLSECRGNAGVTNGGAHMTERMKGESSAYRHCPPDTYEIQEAAFLAQIALANELQLPLMIHTRGPKPGEVSPTGRSVYEDVYTVLKQHAKVPFNVHFYAGTLPEAKQFIELGGSISFTGVVTFAKMYEEIIQEIPLEHMHAETDCPYVAPVPYRGQRCEPWMVQEVYKKIAVVKGVDEEVVREALLQNAQRLYKLA